MVFVTQFAQPPLLESRQFVCELGPKANAYSGSIDFELRFSYYCSDRVLEVYVICAIDGWSVQHHTNLRIHCYYFWDSRHYGWVFIDKSVSKPCHWMTNFVFCWGERQIKLVENQGANQNVLRHSQCPHVSVSLLWSKILVDKMKVNK